MVWLYILRCSDGTFYTGTTRRSLEARIGEHNAAHYIGFTAKRRPVRLVFAQEFNDPRDAISAERQVKGWSRAKKAALIAGQFDLLVTLARRRRSLD
jgi:putative endonuclease